VPSTHEPKAGEIWYVDFDPQVGREQGGIRPALVISNDYFNRVPNELHFIVPITGTDRNIRHHVRVTAPEGNLTKPSIIMCDQARSQSIERFLRLRGMVSPETLRLVQRKVAEIIDA
jgi:mRNA interferase MazF